MAERTTTGFPLRNWAVNAFSALGGLRVTKWLTRRSPRIIMYHRFAIDDDGRKMGVATFERQVKLLKKNFCLISVSSLGRMIQNGQSVPANIAVITIDDGYVDFYNYAFPILRRYGVPATFYVTTGFVDREVWLWPDVVEYIIGNTRKHRWSIEMNGRERCFELSERTEKRQVWVDTCQYSLTLEDRKKNSFLKELAEQLGVHVPTEPINGCTAVSWHQLREMSRAGIEIAGHTRTHPRLVKLEQDRLKDEIVGCKQRIEEMIGQPVHSFAYPNGEKEDYDENIKNWVERTGYTTATVGFPNEGAEDRFELGRYSVGSDINGFRKALWGARLLSERMRKFLKKSRV